LDRVKFALTIILVKFFSITFRNTASSVKVNGVVTFLFSYQRVANVVIKLTFLSTSAS